MRQKLGQHFLKNESVLKKIAAATGAKDGDVVVEIGPGHGELTGYLLKAVGKNGKIVALERDPSLVSELEEQFKDRPQLQIITGDAIENLPDVVSGLQKYILAGNIPYYLTGFLLRNIEGLENKPMRTVLTIQKEVAERLLASPPHMNRLSAAVRFWSEPEIIGLISRNDFSPPPDVDSATILLKTKENKGESNNYYRALNALFKQPRKTILNNLEEGLKIPKQELEKKLKELGLDPVSRPQNLSIEDITAISTSRWF